MTTDAADRLITVGDWLSADIRRYLPCAVRASRPASGVHLIGYNEDGTLLRELFSRDGVGTIITRESGNPAPGRTTSGSRGTDPAAGGGRHSGAPFARTAEREISASVVEHDGMIVGCAALYPYGEDQAELACVAVHPHFRRWGYGEQVAQAH